MSLRLRLPEEVVGERAVLEGPNQEAQEVHTIPLEGPLDPLLEEAVESQPIVERGVSGGSPEITGTQDGAENSVQEEKNPNTTNSPAKKTPMGFLVALGAGVAVLVGVVLGVKGGTHGGSSGTPAGAGSGLRVHAPGPRLWE